MRIARTAVVVAFALTLFGAVAPVAAQNSSIEVADDIALTSADLECGGTLFIHVAKKADVEISLPADILNDCTPSVVVTANNAAIFTVTVDGSPVLNHFTTRGGVYRNRANGRWIRFL